MSYLLAAYFLILLAISLWASRSTTDKSFYRGDRQSPWYMVAFGMIGASISGVSFVSVPGMVLHSGYTYLEVCLGFIVGYFVVAYMLLPIYYKQNLTSIYTYLKRISNGAYRTGSVFFIISKVLGASAKFYVPCFIISSIFGYDFSFVTVTLLIVVWLYTRRGGIKSLVWTDTLQTLCMLVVLAIITYSVSGKADFMQHVPQFVSKTDGAGRFLLNFLSGIFIVIVMTGLDQDMMQKNLTCRTLRDAQKDMCTYGFAFLPVNAMFLILGTMLVGVYANKGMSLPAKPDELLSSYCVNEGGALLTLFVLGIAATSLSSVDSALTALTTIVCIDIVEPLRGNAGTKHGTNRNAVHLVITAIIALCCIMFERLNTTSLIDVIYKLVGYTYGPLLGLFAYAMMHGRHQPETQERNLAPACVCIISTVICLALDHCIPMLTGYHFGYELLMINGIITYLGLLFLCGFRKKQ